MKILILNQPTKNRGDEAAHRSLLRSLSHKFPDVNFEVAIFGEIKNSVEQLTVQANNVTYISIKVRGWLMKRYRFSLVKYAYLLNIAWILLLFPAYRKMLRYIRNSDLIINAPGGICMGLFRNWHHLLWLKKSKDYNKKIAYYSRSFGPFPVSNKEQLLFKTYSIEMLRYFSFLSIRDSKTIDLAEEIKVPYVSSIDTAFLDVPSVKIPVEILAQIGVGDYLIFVPNKLVWHRAYFDASLDRINDFYLKVLDVLHKKYPLVKIVMLPQLFNDENNSDYLYFENLRKCSSVINSISVIPDIYSSDIQQMVISNAQIVVGARYHSIVFAINNQVPFISFSYEHKMVGLLSILNLLDREIDITKLGSSDFNDEVAIMALNRILEQDYKVVSETRKKANGIACNSFELLCKNFINKYYV